MKQRWHSGGTADEKQKTVLGGGRQGIVNRNATGGAERAAERGGNKTTVRGFSAVSLMLVEEAARVDDRMYLALRPIWRCRMAMCG